MMHATALRMNGKWVDFEFTPSVRPLETAMRHVLPEFRKHIKPVVLASYTDAEFDALMETPLYTAFIALYDSAAMLEIGTGLGFNDFVNGWFHTCKVCGVAFQDDGFDTCENCDGA